jgi:hypothetical protein
MEKMREGVGECGLGCLAAINCLDSCACCPSGPLMLNGMWQCCVTSAVRDINIKVNLQGAAHACCFAPSPVEDSCLPMVPAHSMRV